MVKVNILGETVVGNIQRDNLYLSHELSRVRKEIHKLRKREAELKNLLGKDSFSPSSDKFFSKSIHLYVLELTDNKYYVGMTRNVEKRYRRHISGKGAQWTKLHKPIRIVKTIDTNLSNELEVAILENRLTFDMATQHGLDNVRGGGYCQMHPKWPQHLYDQFHGTQV